MVKNFCIFSFFNLTFSCFLYSLAFRFSSSAMIFFLRRFIWRGLGVRNVWDLWEWEEKVAGCWLDIETWCYDSFTGVSVTSS